MARLRRLYGAAADPDHDDFTQRLKAARLYKLTLDKTETVETEFERIQNWYRTPRFAADTHIKDLIEKYRSSGRKRAGSDGTKM